MIYSKEGGVKIPIIDHSEIRDLQKLIDLAEGAWQDLPSDVNISPLSRFSVFEKITNYKPPKTESLPDMGGFTYIGDNVFVVFRFNRKLKSAQEMVDDLTRICAIEFFIRSELREPTALIPNVMNRVRQESFLSVKDNKFRIDFWNHSFEPDLQNRYLRRINELNSRHQ